MAHHWPETQRERLLPPPVRDARGRATLAALDHIIAAQTMPGPGFLDPETCPSAALPALVAEMSMEEFIAPGLPEPVIRRILKDAWRLQSLEGYDVGVKLGLGLLGMKAEITHWWQMDPPGPPDTHRITFYVGEQLFANDNAVFGPGETRAALRMIDATKRWSQESTVLVGALQRLPALRTALRMRGLSLTRVRLRAAQQPPRLPLRLSASPSLKPLTVTRLRLVPT